MKLSKVMLIQFADLQFISTNRLRFHQSTPNYLQARLLSLKVGSAAYRQFSKATN